jgi:tetratricopeptide (TPR) repeat protein
MPSKFNPDKFYGKVLDLLDEEDYSGALKLLETVPPAHKKKNEYHFGKAMCYYHLDEDEKALTHLNKISSKSRKDPDYQFLKAGCHYCLGRDKDMDPAIQAYSNAIELYESDPKSLEWFIDEDIPIARSNLLGCMAVKGMNELNETNLKSVQESLDYIMEHHSDCMDEDSFGPTGVFLVKCSLSDEFSDRKEDYIDLSITSLEKAIKKCEKDSQDLPFYKNVLGYAYSLSGINAIEKGDISSTKRMAKKIIGMDLTLSDEYEAYLTIGIFLVSCYNIKDLLETDEQYLLNAQTFLSECLKSDVKDIKNTSKLYLGILNIDNQDAFNDYTRGLEFDDELFNDIYIIFQTLHDLNKKPRSVIQALNNLKERKNIPELLINLILVIAYREAKEKSKAKKLLTEIKREDFSNYFHLLPVFDLACCVVLNSSEAKVHLEEWVEQYPDSERFNKFLESAEKENLDAIKGEIIEILIPNSFNNYSIITSNKIKVPSYTIDHGSQIKLKDGSKQPGEKGKLKKQKSPHPEYKNHLILTPKYKTGNKHQNIIQYYDKKGQLQVDEIFQDDMFDFIYYIIWMKEQDKPPLHFTYEVPSHDQKQILQIKDTFGIKRFTTKWATSKDSDTKRRRYSAVNKKLGYDLLVYQGEKFQLKGDVTYKLKDFPDI